MSGWTWDDRTIFTMGRAPGARRHRHDIIHHGLAQNHRAASWEIRVKDRDRAEEIARKLEKQLGGIPYTALDWYTLNRALFDAEQLRR